MPRFPSPDELLPERLLSPWSGVVLPSARSLASPSGNAAPPVLKRGDSSIAGDVFTIPGQGTGGIHSAGACAANPTNPKIVLDTELL